MEKQKLTDDEFLEVLKDARAWKKRDAERTIKFQGLIRQAKRKRLTRISVLVVTAAAAVIIGIVKFPWSVTRQMADPDNLYAQFYEPYRISTDYRDGTDNSEQLYNRSVKAYQEKELEKARLLTDSLLAVNPDNPDYRLMHGLTSQALGKYQEAIDSYQLLIPLGGSYNQHARWYAALCYLKLGNVAECKKQLNNLKGSGSFYREKAEKLGRLVR